MCVLHGIGDLQFGELSFGEIKTNLWKPYAPPLASTPDYSTSCKNTMSARKQRLIQSNLLHHHGIRAELSHRTLDFSTHDHHIQALRILTEALSTGFK